MSSDVSKSQLGKITKFHAESYQLAGERSNMSKQRFNFEGPFNMKSSAHEQIAHLALKQAGLVSADSFADSTVVPYLRGVVWNDDPKGQMFDRSDHAEWDWSTGVAWLFDYRTHGGLPSDDLYERSFFGDMMFLHSMTPTTKECPSEIVKRLMLWAEFTFKVATGVISPCTSMRHVYLSDGASVGLSAHPYNVY